MCKLSWSAWQNDAEGEELFSFTLKQLALEELLSEKQYLEFDKALLEDEFSKDSSFYHEN